MKYRILINGVVVSETTHEMFALDEYQIQCEKAKVGTKIERQSFRGAEWVTEASEVSTGNPGSDPDPFDMPGSA